MSNSLLDTHAGTLLVVKGAEGEWECSGLLLDLGEGETRGLHLELVVDVAVTLVHGSTRVLGTGLEVSIVCHDSTHLAVGSGDNQNVDTINLTLLESLGSVVALQLWGRVEEDTLLAVRDVLLVVARKHALNGDTVVLGSDLLDNLGDVPVLVSGLESAHSSLSSVVSGSDDIGGSSLNLVTDNDSLGDNDRVTVNVNTSLDLDDIAVLELDLGVGSKGGDVGDDVVDGDTGGECRA